MASNEVTNPLEFFVNQYGDALEGGKVYIGQVGLDPVTNPKTAYFDRALTITAAQPIRTVAGVPSLSGAAKKVYTDGSYSIKVTDQNDVLIYTSLVEGVLDATGGNEVDTFADLDALTAADVAVGAYVRVTSIGATYQAVASGEHFTTAGGLKVVVLPGADGVDVRAFGAVGDGVTDDTAAIQAAIDAAIVKSRIVLMPAGEYLVTDTLNIPMYAQIKGEHSFQNSRGYGVEPLGTKISFTPSSPKTLFQASGPKPLGGFYRSSYLLDGLYLVGNSTNASGNSVYGLDLDSVSYSTFKNITIEGFRTGVRVFFSINNRFENIHIANSYVQCLLYDASTATTDVWDQCTFHYAPVGIQLSGASIGIRFTECLFEGLENYGVNIDRESFGHTFVNCYAEEVPSTANPNGAMFRVGHDGTTLTVSNALTVVGGYYGGRNTGAIGSFIDVDFAASIMVSNPVANRYTNGIKTSANTYIDSVIVSGMQVASVVNIVTDFTKVNGLYPHAQIGTVGAEQRIRTPVFITDEVRARAAGVGVFVGGTVDCPVRIATAAGTVGFFGGTPQAKPTITGSRGGNTALANLLTQLAALGLITNSTT